VTTYTVSGRAHWDTVARTAELNSGGDSEGTVVREIGGVAARLACGIAGCTPEPVRLLAGVGDDQAGRDLRGALASCGVDLVGVAVPVTGNYVAVEGPDGVHVAVSDPAGPAHPLPTAVEAGPGDVLVVDTSLPEADLRQVRAIAEQAGAVVSVVCTRTALAARLRVFAGMDRATVHVNLAEACAVLGAPVGSAAEAVGR
jgi:sugar/nucleoside kinase (ribokinase family)